MKINKQYTGDDPTGVVVATTVGEIDKRTGMATGMEVATIEVRHPDDGITRFWVSLRVTKRGRVKCEVATNLSDGRSTRSASVTGHKWRNPRDLESD